MTRVVLIAFCVLACTVGRSRAADIVFPAKRWQRAAAGDAGLNPEKLKQAQKYAQTGGGAGYIVRHGKLVWSWGDDKRKFDLKSTSKSIGVTALGLAIADGKLRLNDRAVDRHPRFGIPPESNGKTDWLEQVTLKQLATQTAGFKKPGGYESLLFRPGTQWYYSDGGPNWLAECVTFAYGRDVQDVMFERVLTPIGITKSDLHWRNHAYRDRLLNKVARREFGSGVHANVNAMARLGLLYLNRGRWNDKQMVAADFIDQVRRTQPEVVGLPEFDDAHGNASDHYGLLWWNNADGAIVGVPRDAYWSWGLYESLIVVIPSLDIVASRAGTSWKRQPGSAHYDVLAPFLQAIASSVVAAETEKTASGPYPPSPVIRDIAWAAPRTVVRKAPGGDNWPITSGRDAMYTAFGDGFGFRPLRKKKLSMGFARITGGPKDFVATNMISPTGETTGDGARGRKASGLLMVDGVLYLLVRNAKNAQLASSADNGKTWNWADWTFRDGFGCPTFLNFGPDYANARDEFVYAYSFDSETAYKPADRMVLARVPKTSILDKSAWSWFMRMNEGGQPVWSSDAADRGAVFEHPGRCYRGGVTFNRGIKRYFLCQNHADSRHPRGPRFQGGFGIYDAPEPWGPWTTVFFTNDWDMGPGESSSFPTEWMSDEGRTVHLVFSGEDHFSVRKAVLQLRQQKPRR